MKKLNFVVLIQAVLLVFSFYCYAQEKNTGEKLAPVLNIYNWEDYIAPTAIEGFEKKFGVKVNLETFKDEEEMISSIQSNPGKYDVVITANNVVRTMIESRLLEPIDLGNISNFKNIDSRFVNLDYDPGNKYSVPYIWGTTGIAYNTKYVKEDVDSWGIFWDSKYKGKMSLLVNPYDVFSLGLKYMGYSLNSTDLSQLEAVGKKLMEEKPFLCGYEDAVTIRDKLISGELWIGHIYSGDAISACDKNSDIKYVIPKEGVLLWVDNLCVPHNARHKRTAEVFINYILEPKVSADIANYLVYANCNKAARDYTLKEILDNPTVYPSDEMLKDCEFYKDTDNPEALAQREKAINKIWSELQAK
ncbi:MAG: spermidine/putrescine ABC transporter substrate-binding protein [Candidatus Omnitrophota bacterium]